jgi:hypothetical protein
MTVADEDNLTFPTGVVTTNASRTASQAAVFQNMLGSVLDMTDDGQHDAQEHRLTLAVQRWLIPNYGLAATHQLESSDSRKRLVLAISRISSRTSIPCDDTDQCGAGHRLHSQTSLLQREHRAVEDSPSGTTGDSRKDVQRRR